MSNRTNGRTGAFTGPQIVIVALLAAILLALLVLIVSVYWPGGGTTTGTGGTKKNGGSVIGRETLPDPPPAPKLIGDPGRIKEVAQAGKTYEVLVKGGFDARVEDKDWGIAKVANLGFMFELPVTRTIESNDGQQIVEVREFGQVLMAKLLCETDVTIQLGVPGMLVLGTLEYIAPGSGTVLVAVKPVAETLLAIGAQAAIDDEMTKVKMRADSLSGKKVRITYVDGEGVKSVEPLGCTLDEAELDLIFQTAVLSDYYILPDLESVPGDTWSVDASQLIGFLDPSLRGRPRGTCVFKRDANHQRSNKLYANLRIESGTLELDSSDASRRRLLSFTPRGTLRYNVTDGFVETADLDGKILVEEVSQDHILFESRFRSTPTLKVNYSCKIR
ncbi:MAG: hypothetical protein KJ000_24535 [Pirellulaceae bacterium]|nr:hypothetical protein [Pirellulaceae bacterium]